MEGFNMLVQNEGSVDRIVRVVIGIVFMILGFAVVSGTWGIILGIVGLIALATGAVGTCLLYLPFGINTKK
jgi:hypothetical protein